MERAKVTRENWNESTEANVTYNVCNCIYGVDGVVYDRIAIRTHFIQCGEDAAALIERYVLPIYRRGDVLIFGSKAMCMCTNSVRTRESVKPGLLARLLWRFAGCNSAGIGMHEPYKLQLVIEICGTGRVLLAAFCSAVTRPFGVRGVFYRVCGHDVGSIDGFYPRASFEMYKNLALINPPNADRICEELRQRTGVPVVLMDANDFDRNQIGKSRECPLSDEEIQLATRDNPAGQGAEQTPLVLIRRQDSANRNGTE